VKSWNDFSAEEPEIAMLDGKLLFRSREHVGYAFIATLRKDGAPRLHPISVILSKGHLYVVIPRPSPKCIDLLRDGRYAVQAFPLSPNAPGDEFYLAGCAYQVRDPNISQGLTEDTKVTVEENETLFELFVERAMYTELVNRGAVNEHPIRRKWRANRMQSLSPRSQNNERTT
jgi:hypothetical protein